MAHLLYSASDARGKPEQGFVEAASAEEARRVLAQRGLRDVVLHQETSISTDARALAGLGPAERRELARLRIEAMRTHGLWPMLKATARSNALWLVIDALILAVGLWQGNHWLAAAGAAFLLLPFAVAAWKSRHGDRYTRLIKSFAVGDWEQVQTLAAKLRGLGLQSHQLEFDLDVRLASIRARRGELAQALTGLEPWRARLASFPGLYESRVATVHAAGADRAGFVRLMAEACDRSQGEPARKLDLALAQARFGDAAAAAELLQSVDASLLPPHASHFIAWTEGLVHLRQGRTAEAVKRLGEAIAGLLAKAPTTPAVWTSLAFCTCDHAVALAGAGRKEEARRELGQVWAIVRAHADQPLIRMLQAEGLAPQLTT